MKFANVMLSTAAAVGLLAAGAIAADTAVPGPSGSWISISGTVGALKDTSFVLDHGSGKITIDMPRLGTGWNNIKATDRVTVHGKIDDNIFKKRTIDASAVYDDRLHRYFYAEAAEHERSYTDPVDTLGREGSWVSLVGVVKVVNGREFTIDTGAKDIRVDTKPSMKYDPSEGPFGLKKGDRVLVQGRIDKSDFFEKGEIDANSVVVMSGLNGKTTMR